MGFRTGVQLPSGPLYSQPSNPVSKLKIGVRHNIACISITFDAFDFVKQEAPATYGQIQAWVKNHYGVHVSNLSISQTKERHGLAKTEYKGYKGSEGHYIPKLKPEREKMILEAFRHFGMI